MWGATFFHGIASAIAIASELPCDIHAIQIENSTMKVYFTEKADWRVGKRFDRMISGKKVLYFQESQQDDFVIEEEALMLSDGVAITLWLPHIGCTLEATIKGAKPGLLVRQETWLTGRPATEEVTFLPVPQ